MADKVDRETRSRTMARVSSKNTPPEMAVRRALHKAGYRFRLHRKDLPGVPDVVLPKHKLAIFVHGCFWHQHQGCRRSVRPTSNTGYWNAKLDRNMARDRASVLALQEMGWGSVILWECETLDDALILDRVRAALSA
ncbi:MAG TPA: very short patch repair endonuclease [Armatimonadota bacterium]|jgi:DNA mismatch endonuclease (patch repair protein)